MAYVSLIQQDWHAEAFRHGNAYQVVVNVGCDEALNFTYSIAVGLDPLPGGDLEYHFYLARLNESDGQIETYLSGTDSINIVPKVQRGAIRRAMLHATKTLLGQVNPATVSWCTHDENLPEKALIKYREVVRVFESSGYRVFAGEPHHGRYLWSAERLNPPSFPFDAVEGDGQ